MEEEMNKERLLQKYYDGETTLAEEKWLKESVLCEVKSIEKLIFKDQKTLTHKATIHKKQRNRKIRFITVCSLMATACTVLFVSKNPLGSSIENNVFETKIGKEILVSNIIEGSIEDPEIALEQARKALAFVSEKLNTGTENINHLNKLNQVKE